MALDLAMDAETIMGIVKVIPEAEGADFAALKEDALVKLNAMKRGIELENAESSLSEPNTLHGNRRDDLFKRIAEKV